jgi:putative aminopeptidase FrvX
MIMDVSQAPKRRGSPAQTNHPGSNPRIASEYEKDPLLRQEFLEILRDVISIESPSGREERLARHIASRYFPREDGWQVRIDAASNLFAFPSDSRGGIPLLTAHLDTYPLNAGYAHLLAREDALSLDEERDMLVKKYPIQYGFDDKAGVALALLLSRHLGPRVKVLFTTEEEIGRHGIQHALSDKESAGFFEGVPFALTLDRNSTTHDIVSTYSGHRMCPDAFVRELEAISGELGTPMKECESRSRADCYNISLQTQIPIVNLSCGYSNQHSDEDALNVAFVLNTLRLVRECVTTRRDGLVRAARGEDDLPVAGKPVPVC